MFKKSRKFYLITIILFVFCSFCTFVLASGEQEYVLQRAGSSAATRFILPSEGQPFEIVNPCTDFGFKRAFGNPGVLIDFLNHILDYRGGNQIVDLSYMDKEFPSLHPLGRDFRVDIVCQTLNNRYFLIEMQNDYTADYADKAYVEFSRFLAKIDGEKLHDLSSGDHKRRRIGQTDIAAQDFWQKIEEVCTLVISNKRFDPHLVKQKYAEEAVAEPDIINTYEMLNTTHPTRHLGSLDAKVVLVMLANFNKTADELLTDTDRWLYALKDERMTTGKLKIEPFKDVLDIQKTAFESEALKQFYAELHKSNIGHDLLKEYEEQIQADNFRLERTFIEGKAEGKIEGKIEERRVVALKMISSNMSDELIVQVVGITPEELDELKRWPERK
jgi:hypothetical protein